VSGYPILLDGAQIRALVVGGGAVATRKVRGLLESGASVRVVAPGMAADLRVLSEEKPGLTLIERAYQTGDIGDATLVFAATSVRAVNARVAADARAAGRLVNVADAPAEGDWANVAVHRAGPLVIGVSAGGVPSAAVRIRDAIGQRFDGRYAEALAALAQLRKKGRNSPDTPTGSKIRSDSLIGPDFCERVERGEIGPDFRERVERGEVAAWR
jgi:precorrin-2 dehydrogenase / sirohydrochlorin ferrochelatase